MYTKKQFFTLFILLSLVLALAACNASNSHEAQDEHTHTEAEATAEAEATHDHATDHQGEAAPTHRIPNDGATIRIISPADGAEVSGDEDTIVQIEVENFELGDTAGHWHVYVDGASWGMVMGNNTDQVLRGLEAGKHEISVYLSNQAHDELEDGDTITITVQ